MICLCRIKLQSDVKMFEVKGSDLSDLTQRKLARCEGVLFVTVGVRGMGLTQLHILQF